MFFPNGNLGNPPLMGWDKREIDNHWIRVVANVSEN